MRIHVLGNSHSATVLKALLLKSDFRVTDQFPHYRIELIDGSDITISSTEGELESAVFKNIRRLTKRRIIFISPTERHDLSISVTVPHGNQESAVQVERGIFQALCELAHIDKRPSIRRRFGLALSMVLVATGLFAQQADSVPMSQDTGLQLRNLQFQQDKKLLEELKLQVRYAQLEKEVETLQNQIVGTCQKAAEAQKVSLDKYACDLDALHFIKRPEPPAEKKK